MTTQGRYFVKISSAILTCPPLYRIGGKQQTIERVWRRPVNSSNIAIKGAGHLVCPLIRVERS
jgi:hypothetical protein